MKGLKPGEGAPLSTTGRGASAGGFLNLSPGPRQKWGAFLGGLGHLRLGLGAETAALPLEPSEGWLELPGLVIPHISSVSQGKMLEVATPGG